MLSLSFVTISEKPFDDILNVSGLTQEKIWCLRNYHYSEVEVTGDPRYDSTRSQNNLVATIPLAGPYSRRLIQACPRVSQYPRGSNEIVRHGLHCYNELCLYHCGSCWRTSRSKCGRTLLSVRSRLESWVNLDLLRLPHTVLYHDPISIHVDLVLIHLDVRFDPAMLWCHNLVIVATVMQYSHLEGDPVESRNPQLTV